MKSACSVITHSCQWRVETRVRSEATFISLWNDFKDQTRVRRLWNKNKHAQHPLQLNMRYLWPLKHILRISRVKRLWHITPERQTSMSSACGPIPQSGTDKEAFLPSSQVGHSWSKSCPINGLKVSQVQIEKNGVLKKTSNRYKHLVIWFYCFIALHTVAHVRSKAYNILYYLHFQVNNKMFNWGFVWDQNSY